MFLPALALTALSLAAAPGKDAPPVRWLSSWTGAFEEAKARNVPVLIVFGKDH